MILRRASRVFRARIAATVTLPGERGIAEVMALLATAERGLLRR
jgi:hypothetical protein